MEQGRLEDVGQLSRTIHQQIRVQKVVAFKPMWWLSAMNGNRNDLTGRVLAYEAIHGAGAAVVSLDPTPSGAGDKEYDEDDVEYFHGERGVLDAVEEEVADERNSASEQAKVDGSGPELWEPTEASGSVNTNTAPKPVGAYPHARRVGDMLFLSGLGPDNLEPMPSLVARFTMNTDKLWITIYERKPTRWLKMFDESLRRQEQGWTRSST